MQQQRQLEADHPSLPIKKRSVPSNIAVRWKLWGRKVVIPYLFLAPFMLLFIVFFLLPLGYALAISLFADRLVGGTVFVGGQNYLQVLQDGAFWDGVRRMVVFGIV